MREIKFRAWDKDKMVQWPEWAITFRGNLLKEYAPNFDYLSGSAIPPIMQYTGLKDKNGKEIYESDIMLLPAGAPENDDSYMVVKFGDTGDGRWGFWLDGCLSGSFIDVFTSHEVIGNIYSNPELLI